MKKFEGSRLKTARMARGWGLSDLHFQLLQSGFRLSLQSLRNWENNKAVPSSNHLAALIQVLGKNGEYFFV